MAREVRATVHLVARPSIDMEGLAEYLATVGAPDWRTDTESDGDLLAEVMGRLCYRSWKPGLNPNITKVREGNRGYLRNILESGHGSVLEHAQYSFIFANISRVFTHELVRHRVGVAISQESLRYVRLSDGLRFPFPDTLAANDEGAALIRETMDPLEVVQGELARIYKIDEMKDFTQKKSLTSAFRRVAPIGLATTIGWSANLRTLRHVLEMRTSRHAEREIRDVFAHVGAIMMREAPAAFSDYAMEMVDGLPEFTTPNRKV